jgi:hypothetical protein
MTKVAATVVVNILTAAVGTLIVVFIGAKPHVGTILWTLLAIGLTIVVINYQSRLALMLSGKGKWTLPTRVRSEWQFDTSEGSAVIDDIIALRVIGALVLGTGRSTSVRGDVDLPSFEYKIVANIRSEGIIEGRWSSNLASRNFYGTFQLQLVRGAEKGPIATGKWLGVSRRANIRSGSWDWFSEDKAS